MAPRKKESRKGGNAIKDPRINPDSSFTPENFEAELKRMASQAKEETWSKWLLEQSVIYGKAASLLAIAAVHANVSQLTLSPIYGGIPAAIWHSKIVMTAAFLGWAGNLALRRMLPVRTAAFIPLIAAYVPVIQFYLFKLSGVFAAKLGPAVTEICTLLPLMVLSVASVADVFEQADLSGLPKWAGDAAPGFVSYGIYAFFEVFSVEQLQYQIGRSVVQTRIGVELLLAGLSAAMAPSKFLLIALPALFHTVFINTHLMTPMATQSLNATLNIEGWSLVDRRESLTGYISVLDSHENGYRVMRCDHSLLGGEWTKLGRKIVGEPIFAVFAMLEAVRLVENSKEIPDSEAKALNIGLGIGTTPSALIAHGISTTIVEIDPVVYEYAVKYFGLPANHTAVIEDAVSYTARLAKEGSQKFDYIIHDVFTGGAEPISLFTIEFLQDLRTLLKPTGVIAINYAGDFLLPPLSTVVRTVRSVFPTCRIFRESPQLPTAEKISAEGRDFDNVIIFCRRGPSSESADDVQNSPGTLKFRLPNERDFLDTHTRRAYLMPKNEVSGPESFLGADDKRVGVVRRNETEWLGKWHDQTAVGHWAIMREVVPKKIWENW